MPKRVLLIDPDAVSRKVTARLLNQRGHAVFPALSFEEAIPRLKPGVYDAVLFSATNEQEEAALCRRIRNQHPQQFVIVLMTRQSYQSDPLSCPDQVVRAETPQQVAEALDATLRTSAFQGK